MEKAAAGIFGNNEFVLRFIPLAASIASILLFFILARRCRHGGTALMASAIFIFAGPLVHYSVQVKHYALDVLVAVSSFVAVDYIRATRLDLWRALALGMSGAVAVWFSYGAIFVWAGIFPTLILFRLLRRQFGDVAMVGLVVCFGMLSFYGLYVNDFGQIGRNSQLHVMWEKAFMPWPIGSWVSVVWLQDAFLNMFRDILGLSWAPLAAGLFVLGAVAVFREDKERASLLLSPLAIALGAAMAHKYPFSGRSVLFLAPSLAMLTAEGMTAVAAKFPKMSTVTTLLLGAGILFHPLNNAIDVLIRSHASEEMRPAMRYIKEHHRPQDAVYLNNSAQYAYGYYSGYYGLDIKTPFAGVIVDALKSGENFDLVENVAYMNYIRTPGGFLAGRYSGPQIDALFEATWRETRYNKRTWVILSHASETCRRAALDVFEREGRRLDEFHSAGVSIYLYDLSKT
ncbi:MAG: hypothetical protein HZA29_04755 [Candidatus Omnitrophica bacterium]|nr:hypothetical protein [Candidatus Omnitrophota bacterium]